MERIKSGYKAIKEYLEIPLLEMGETDLTLWLILYFIFSIAILYYLTKYLRRLMVRRLLPRYIPDLGVRQAIASIVRYALMFIGLLVIFQSAGLDLSTLTLLAGALGVGIGFGLQNITNNFVSGIVILFERPVKVGDRIEVGGTHGRVMNISPRATTILTNDNIAIIVPNSEFISQRVINWSYSDDKIRFRIKVRVAYGSDLHQVKRLLLEVADENKDVLKEPPTTVRVNEFGIDGIEMELLPWSSSLVQQRGKFISDINFAIADKFKKNDIIIPYPQRDLHLKSGLPLEK